MTESGLELRRSLEQLARDSDPGRSAAICAALGAEDRGLLVQRDTYFQGPQGRLKLREERGRQALLIFHARVEAAQEGENQYQLIGVRKPGVVMEALTASLDVEVVVAKERRLFLWEGVRIHLDYVEGLGHFIQLDAPAFERSDLAREREQLAALRRAFGIAADDLIAAGYADLALGNVQPAKPARLAQSWEST